MIRLEPINTDLGNAQFCLRADEPMRVEVIQVDDHLLAMVYTGTETDMDQEPIGCFDSTIGRNATWEHDTEEGEV